MTLTSAQKAWQTRRLRAEARVEIVAKKAGTDLPSPVADAAMVELYVDDRTIGCGLRRFVVVEIGRKAVKLFSAPRLINHTIDRYTFNRKAKPVAFNRRTVARIIRENMEQVRRLAIEPTEGARRLAAGKAALAILKAGRA